MLCLGLLFGFADKVSWVSSQFVSKHEGDLVGKFYYAKRKLVWEILDNRLKSKIEIQWSDIASLQATFQEKQPDVLEIEVNHLSS